MWEVNGEGAGHVAAAARAAGARLIHLSSDLVFDGRLPPGRAYREEDPADPLLAYGASKLRGEAAVLAADATALVVRTSLIYGGDRLTATERLVLDAADGCTDTAFFSDELRSPVEAGDLAGALLELAGGGRAGLLHVAGPDRIDRHSFAGLVAQAHGRDPGVLRAARSADLPQRRPRNCALDSAAAHRLLRRRPRSVREVLLPAPAQAPG
jgi:dTDP-4-dehydrorhamnose reductase